MEINNLSYKQFKWQSKMAHNQLTLHFLQISMSPFPTIVSRTFFRALPFLCALKEESDYNFLNQLKMAHLSLTILTPCRI